MHTSIDLFAGAGGLSTGLCAAGFSVVGAVEVDPTAAATYRLNHCETKIIIADIRDVTGPGLLQQVGLARGELDLLTGCPPCQGFSTLQTRRRGSRQADPRNDLILEVLRLTRSMRPRAVIIENVPGLATDERFTRFCEGLTKSGYVHDHAVLDAADFGVPQRRKRLVLFALRDSKKVPTEWAAPTHSRTQSVYEAIGRLPPAGNSGDKLHDLPERRSAAMMTRIVATPKDGGSRRDIPRDLGCRCHNENDGYSDVYGRMKWHEVSPTITSGCHNPSKGRFLHPEENRAITLREAAILQTFPLGYEFVLSRGKEHVAQQIGNAFPPKLIQPLANRLRQELDD